QLPNENWAFNAGSTNLNYLLSGFNMISAPGDTIEAIGMQYRFANGLNQGGSTDGWSEAVTLRRSAGQLAITDKSKNGMWVPSGSDGAYELRAFTECGTGEAKRFVYTDPVPGLVDRKAPGVLGNPEPADGSLALGDDIEIAFDERIDCASIDTDAIGSLANLQLSYVDGPNASTSISGIQTACNGEKIVIRPPDTFDWNAAEGLQLEARLYNGGLDAGNTIPTVIKDLAGNPLPEQRWTFTVRRSEVAWQRGSLTAGVQTSTNQMITATLVNGSSLPVQFTLPERFTLANGPSTVTVTPLITSGEINPGEAKSIGFTFPATATNGTYTGSINATTSDGPLTLYFNVAVGSITTTAPSWIVNGTAFQYSMSVLGTLQFAGTVANDASDQVAAFVGNEVRGIATVDPTNGRFFMTIYGHQPGETVTFQAYDASNSTLFQGSDQVLTFADQGTHGTPASPLVVIASQSPQGMQSIPLAQGWTWFSVNRDAPNTGIDAVLGAIPATDGDLIKDGSNTNFYLASATQQTWSQMGSISMISPGRAYQIKLAQPSTLVISGNATPLAPIALQAGWNWLGYTPQSALPVGTALSSLTPSAGDLIKSQTQFAQYDGTNWIGSLATMEPGKGYQISLTTSGSLTYPSGNSAGNAALSSSMQISGPGKANDDLRTEVEQPDIVPVDVFSFNPTPFAHSMTLSAEVILDGEVLQDEKVLVWASGKDDGKIRGVAQVQQVGELYRLFLMLHSDVVEGEPLTLSIYDPASDQIFDLESALLFDAQAHHGSMDQPLAFEAMTEGYREALAAAALPKEFALAQNYPNPFNPQTTIHYELPEAVQVRLVVYDMLGREVVTLVDKEQQAGRYDVNFDASRLASGMYLYRIHAGEFTQVQKMVLAK
nr:T9SS type A sorting domain-containing protein [Rhodothermaceae bacterium]